MESRRVVRQAVSLSLTLLVAAVHGACTPAPPAGTVPAETAAPTASAGAPVAAPRREATAPPAAAAAAAATTPPDRLGTPARPLLGPRRPGVATDAVHDARLERLVRRNLDARVSLPESLLAGRMRAWEGRPPGERVALWAELFLERGDATYCFGPKPGGYVADSLLVQDFRHDCVSFFYRCSELARARTPAEAIRLALDTRFAGGDAARLVSPAGGVDYDDAAHLDYSEDILRTEIWGRDVTREVGEAEPDTAGSSRYAPGAYWFAPAARLRLDRLRDGDHLFFVWDEAHPRGRTMRRDFGLLIGHQGIVQRRGAQVFVIHAASKPLPGLYEGNRIVRVPLREYLRRVDQFKGVMVLRLPEANPPTGSP
jgi:hypothetical protein